jgi:hypothetical protein
LSPVKAFTAEIATRPAAAAREDDRNQLVGVVISVELDIRPLVGRETQCVDILGQCGGGERGAENRGQAALGDDSGDVKVAAPGEQRLDQRRQAVFRFENDHVVVVFDDARTGLGVVAIVSADDDDHFRSGQAKLADDFRGYQAVCAVQRQAQNFRIGRDQSFCCAVEFLAEIFDIVRVVPEVLGRRDAPRIGRHFLAGRGVKTLLTVEQAARVVAVVEDHVQVGRLETAAGGF